MSRDTKFSGANVDREIFVHIPFQLTSSVGNLTRLSLLCYMVIAHGKVKDQPGRVADPARGQLDMENKYFPVRIRA